MSVHALRARLLVVLAAALACLWPASAAAPAASSNTPVFSGRATVVQGQVLGIPVGPLADTGPVDSSGGALETTLATYPYDGLPDPTNGALKATVLHATVIAQGNESKAEASTANFTLNAAGHSVSGQFLMAEADVTCSNGTPSVSANVDVATVTVDNQTFTPVPGQSQTITLDGISVAINEQPVFSVSGSYGQVTVNALHIIVPNPTGGAPLVDVIVAQAHADLLCASPSQPQCPQGKDFVTGGGWIVAPDNDRGNFAVAGGVKNNAYWGHLTYIDHGTGMKVKGTGVFGYYTTAPSAREIQGNADIAGMPGTYKVDIIDNGSPGRNDVFTLSLSNGYNASGTLSGGNITIHRPCG
jgi:hypothetical protein